MHLITIGMGLPTYLITCTQLTSKVQNRKQEVRRTYLIKRRSILAYLLPLCSTSKVFRIAPLSPVKRHSSRYKMIHICISRLDKSHIILKCKHLSNHKIWNTYGRSNLFIINNGKSLRYNPTSETRTPLSPKDSEFHCSKYFCRQSTSITLVSKCNYQHPPQGLYLYGWNKAVLEG